MGRLAAPHDVNGFARLLPSVRKLMQETASLREERGALHRKLAYLEAELLKFAARRNEIQAEASPDDSVLEAAADDPPGETPPWMPAPLEPAPDGRRRMTVYIDIFGACNLRCPSCPVSGGPNERAPKGLMSADMLGRILDKATAECAVSSVGLFNWTEPLLHPAVAEMVSVVKSRDLYCSISSNLNVMRDIEAVLAAGLDWLRISVSGFGKESYAQTHRGGDIEAVKDNMRGLAEAVKRTGARTDIEVFFHRYIGNIDDEVRMREFAEGLGFRFVAAWAQMMPVEKVLSYVDPENPEMMLAESDFEVIDRLALPLKDAVALTARYPVSHCPMQDDYLAIDVAGDVALCCAVSNVSGNRIGGFLDTPLADLQARKHAHPLCGKCMKQGLPLYLEHRVPGFGDLARQRLARHYAAQGLDLGAA